MGNITEINPKAGGSSIPMEPICPLMSRAYALVGPPCNPLSPGGLATAGPPMASALYSFAPAPCHGSACKFWDESESECAYLISLRSQKSLIDLDNCLENIQQSLDTIATAQLNRK